MVRNLTEVSPLKGKDKPEEYTLLLAAHVKLALTAYNYKKCLATNPEYEVDFMPVSTSQVRNIKK
jgi:hypothetical protein